MFSILSPQCDDAAAWLVQNVSSFVRNIEN